MVITCFFCQNLLSDYVEGILPANRHGEIKNHLIQCAQCDQTHKDLISSIEILKALKVPNYAPEFSVRIVEASEAGKVVASRPLKISRVVLTYAVPLSAIVLILAFSTRVFPWLSWIQSQADEKQFVRYFPMSNGAIDIIEEQAGWLSSRELRAGSVWEEGGLSPDEFEKSFQKKNPIGDLPE